MSKSLVNCKRCGMPEDGLLLGLCGKCTPASDDGRGKASHSPLPWKWGTFLSGSENHRGYYIHSKHDTFTLANVVPFDEEGIQGEANVKLIVNAVNNHAKLVEALDKEHLKTNKGFECDKYNCKVCQLLKQAKGL